jgi:hypothetical protein
MQTVQTLIFGAEADCLHMEIDRVNDPSSLGYGEARMRMKVRSSGFAGEGSWWAEKSCFDNFVRDVIQLSRTLKGRAELNNQWRQDFAFAIFPITSRGHFAVEGRIAAQIPARERMFLHSVRFGFEIELADIDKAARQLSTLGI